MLFSRTVFAAVLATAAAFQAPLSALPSSRTGAVTMDDSWRRSYDGKGTGVGGGSATASAPSAPSGSMSTTQALAFMQSLGDTPLADKIAFLESKGVSKKVIEDSVCVSPLDRFGPVQGHP